MDTSKDQHFTDLDFREQMLYAVAYRISEMKGVRPETARVWVRDVMKYGVTSTYYHPVSLAVMEMLKPLIGPILPLIPRITMNVVTLVQQQNQRGWDTEKSVERAQ